LQAMKYGDSSNRDFGNVVEKGMGSFAGGDGRHWSIQ